MNPAVLTRFAAPDPNASPLTVGQLVELLNVLVSSEIQGSYMPYVIQNGTPGVDDQDKAWFELDVSGRPTGIKIFWNGHWRRVYNGMIGEIRIFSGDPSNTTLWTTNGLGVVGAIYDGWHICNGKDGTPDLSDRFVIGGHMNNDGSNGWNGTEWVTTILADDGSNIGGVDHITLDATTSYQTPVPPVRAQLFHADGNAPEPHTGDLWGLRSGTDANNDNIAAGIPGNTTPQQISVVNPFIAMGFIIFVGYST